MRFISTLIIVCLVLALSSCGGGGGSTPLGPPSGTAASMFTSLNGLRTANGAAALANNAQIAAIAQAQADRNASIHANSTFDASGKGVDERMQAAGINVVDWIVPVARGNDAEATDRWTNTQVERDLLYSHKWTDMGIGMALDGGVQRWVVIMVQVGP